MTRTPSVLRDAIGLLSVRLVLQQLGLALLVSLFSMAWLRIPDSSIFNVAGTVVLTLLIVALAGEGESWLVLRLSGKPTTLSRFVRGSVLLFAGIALWLAWCSVVAHLQANEGLWAGYLNSRFPHNLRNFFSYAHIVLWLDWLCTALIWLAAGKLVALFAILTASAHPLRTILYAWRRLTCWLAFLFVPLIAVFLSRAIMNWTPGKGLRIELLSLALRFSFTVLVDALAACFLLAVASACVRQSDALYETPEGTPDDSQPRTAESP
jgi:hypothetical protein